MNYDCSLGGMFTANTMSSAVEALGMSLPGEPRSMDGLLFIP